MSSAADGWLLPPPSFRPGHDLVRKGLSDSLHDVFLLLQLRRLPAAPTLTPFASSTTCR